VLSGGLLLYGFARPALAGCADKHPTGAAAPIPCRLSVQSGGAGGICCRACRVTLWA
jgi:hypothetical protein